MNDDINNYTAAGAAAKVAEDAYHDLFRLCGEVDHAITKIQGVPADIGHNDYEATVSQSLCTALSVMLERQRQRMNAPLRQIQRTAVVRVES